MAVSLGQLNVGDVIYHHFDTGAFGVRPVYSKVLKVGPKKIKVQTEMGDVAWKYPDYFVRVVAPKELPELAIEWRGPAATQGSSR